MSKEEQPLDALYTLVQGPPPSFREVVEQFIDDMREKFGDTAVVNITIHPERGRQDAAFAAAANMGLIVQASQNLYWFGSRSENGQYFEIFLPPAKPEPAKHDLPF